GISRRRAVMLGSVRQRTGEAGSICFKAGILRDMGASREPLQSCKNHQLLRGKQAWPLFMT
ncbi:MAG: hypothetical protein Q8K57_18320, partial [Thiobacillus sp.]|nr:hypothetical protein [Thiobacillus sp.]